MQEILTSVKENTRYGYASGRIRVLETRLLNRAGITRLLEAESAEEVLRMLSEGEYGTAISEIQKAEDFEKALEIEMERTYALVDELSLDPELTQIFRIRGDFHNLKVLLKASYLKESASDVGHILVRYGLTPIDDLKLAIEPGSDKKSNKLPDYLTNALEEARAQYEESLNPQMIDFTIDKHLHSFMYQRSADYPNPFLRGYFSAFADLNNIRSFIRMKALGENIRLLDAVILPYGSIDKKRFLRRFDDSIENLAEDLANTPYSEVVAEGVRKWAEEHSLATFEKLMDNFLIDYIKPAKYIIFGVEPLIGYFLAKEHEIKLLRIIMTGKLNHLPTEAINERLRDTYA